MDDNMMTGKPTVDESVQAAAETHGVDVSRVRAYKLDLGWLLQNGVLVQEHFNGTSMLETRASLNELGIQENDIRARRLRPGRRELIDDHPTAQWYVVTPNVVYLGFDPFLGQPPAFYFGLAEKVAGAEIVTETGREPVSLYRGAHWMSLPVEEWPVTEAPIDETEGVGYCPPGQRAHWLVLTLDAEVATPDSIICNPSKAIRSVEARCRQSIKRHSRTVDAFGGFKWINYKSYFPWREEWDALQVELKAIKSYLCWRHSEFIEALRADFGLIAEEAWQSMASRHAGSFAVMLPGGKIADSQDAFVEVIVEQAVNRMPSRDDILARISMDYTPGVLLGEQQVAEEKLKVEELETERQAEGAKQYAAWEAAQAEGRLALEHERLERDKMRMEREATNAMHTAELQRAREIMSDTISPYQEMVDEVAAEMFDGAQAMLASLSKNESLRGKVADRARNFVELMRMILLVKPGDNQAAEMERLIDDLSGRLPKTGGTDKLSPRNSAIRATLSSIVELTREQAHSVSRRKGSMYGFGGLELE